MRRRAASASKAWPDAPRKAVWSSSVTPNDDGSITIELHIVVDHGVNIAALCSSIMNEVSYKVSSATDVSVRQVDVYVDSMTMD